MITYWHNPRCSKSRAGLAFFEERSVAVDVRLYQKDGPSTEELTRVLALLGGTAVQMMRKGDALFKELDLRADMDDAVLIQAMSDHPALIERPIAISGDTARIGRPTEALGDLL